VKGNHDAFSNDTDGSKAQKDLMTDISLWLSVWPIVKTYRKHDAAWYQGSPRIC